MQGNMKKRLMSFTFKNIPCISLGCKVAPVLHVYPEYEYSLRYRSVFSGKIDSVTRVFFFYLEVLSLPKQWKLWTFLTDVTLFLLNFSLKQNKFSLLDFFC